MLKIHSAEKHANSNERAEHEASQLRQAVLRPFSAESACGLVLLQTTEPQLPRRSPLAKGKGPWCSSGVWERHAGGQCPRESSSRAYQRTFPNCPISTRSLKMNIHKIRQQQQNTKKYLKFQHNKYILKTLSYFRRYKNTKLCILKKGLTLATF